MSYGTFEEPHPKLGINACGIMQVYNEQSVDPKHLCRSLESLKRLCHTIIVYDDGSNDGTTEWLKTIGKGAGLVTHLILSEENNWHEEIQHKSVMLDLAHELNGDEERPPIEWVIWLDADEEISPSAHDQILAHAQDDGITGMLIKELNLWRDPFHRRIDSDFDGTKPGWFMRVWRMRKELVYRNRPVGLHHCQYPTAARETPIRLDSTTGRIMHYSWDSPGKINAKNIRYSMNGDNDSIPRMVDGEHVVRVPVPSAFFWVPQPRWSPLVGGMYSDDALGIVCDPKVGFWIDGVDPLVYETEAELMHVVGGII